MVNPRPILDRARVQPTLMRFPAIRREITTAFLARESKRSDLVDSHRVYRCLAAGGEGWSGDQLRALDGLIAALPRRLVRPKLAELWAARDDRAESLATELDLIRQLWLEGHVLEVEPAQGEKVPELRVGSSTLVEAKTIGSSTNPGERLVYKVCHEVPGGLALSLSVEGLLTQQDVGRLVKQLAAELSAGTRPVGTVVALSQGQARLDAKVELLDATDPLGSVVFSGGQNPPGRREFEQALRKFVRSARKRSRKQVSGGAGRAVLICDVSQSQTITDGLLLYGQLALQVAADESRDDVVVLICHRVSQLFGPLRFVPDGALTGAFPRYEHPMRTMLRRWTRRASLRVRSLLFV